MKNYITIAVILLLASVVFATTDPNPLCSNPQKLYGGQQCKYIVTTPVVAASQSSYIVKLLGVTSAGHAVVKVGDVYTETIAKGSYSINLPVTVYVVDAVAVSTTDQTLNWASLKLENKDMFCTTEGSSCSSEPDHACCKGLECKLTGATGVCVKAEPQPTPTCKTLGQMCGGIAAFQCCDGLTCKYDGTYPDAGGTCIRDVKPMPPVSTCNKAPIIIVSDTQTMIDPIGDGPTIPAVLTWDENPDWTADVQDARWIWSEYLVSSPLTDTQRSFSREFTVPTDRHLRSSTILIAADNSYSCALNGVEFGRDDTANNFQDTTQDKYDVTRLVRTGSNVLTCTVKNFGMAESTAQSNPAGLIFRLDLIPKCDDTQPAPTTLEVKVPSRFSLVQGGTVKVVNYKDMTITLQYIVASSAGGGGGTATESAVTRKQSAEIVTGKPTAATTTAESIACPAVCKPMWERQEVQCIQAPCDPVCVFKECGSGCGPDNKKTFATEAECKGQVDSCRDSDGGKNYEVKGTVKYNLNQVAAYQYALTDSCSGSTLNEYYCDDNGNAQTTYYTCPNGCKDGACVSLEPSRGYVVVTVTIPELSAASLTKKSYTMHEGQSVELFGLKLTVKEIGGDSAVFYLDYATTAPPSTCSKEGESCGGFRASGDLSFHCCDGLKCEYSRESDIAADVPGRCVRETSSNVYELKFAKGWNMVSSPVILSQKDFASLKTDCRFASIPWELNVQSQKFQRASSIKPGRGYWLKTAEACTVSAEYRQTVNFADYPVEIGKGWNFIGSQFDAVDFNRIINDCDITSGPYWYNPETNAYQTADTIEPGKAYLVKSANACTLTTEEGAPPSLPAERKI